MILKWEVILNQTKKISEWLLVKYLFIWSQKTAKSVLSESFGINGQNSPISFIFVFTMLSVLFKLKEKMLFRAKSSNPCKNQ